MPSGGVLKKAEQRGSDHNRRERGIDLGGVDDQWTKLKAVIGVGRLHVLRVGPEQDQQPLTMMIAIAIKQQELAVLGSSDESC